MDADIRKLLRMARGGGLYGLEAQDLYDLRDLVQNEIDRQLANPCTLEAWEDFSLPRAGIFVPPKLIVYARHLLTVAGPELRKPTIRVGDQMAYSGKSVASNCSLELAPSPCKNYWAVITESPGWEWEFPTAIQTLA